MANGKSIRIYLADGAVSGIRHGEIVNWSGQAVACPRTRFSSLSDWPEIRRPGVYFLFGSDDETGNDAAYIGEAEVVLTRISDHLRNSNGTKDFWNEVIVFTSKDDHLTKAHVRYLEARLIQEANRAGRYRLQNVNSQQLPALPRADRDSMEDFIESVRTLLGVLGHKALEPQAIARQLAQPTEVAAAIAATPPAVQSETFHLNVSGIAAQATRTDEGVVVLAGSVAALQPQPSLSSKNRGLRETLAGSGILIAENGKLKLARDQLFSSPSQAGSVLVGYPINGREYWRTADGQSWSTVEARNAIRLLDDL